MKERPILFSAPMVRAILEGRKTVTRRIVKPQWPTLPTTSGFWGCGVTREGASYPTGKDRLRSDAFNVHTRLGDGRDVFIYCPYGKPGDRLWVRETWRAFEQRLDGRDGILFRADKAFVPISNTAEAAEAWVAAKRGRDWRPSIFMPRWASRITLEAVDIRVERLHDITDEDIELEGLELSPDGESSYYNDRPDGTGAGGKLPSLLAAFEHLWSLLNGAASWRANPWVWRVAFRRLP